MMSGGLRKFHWQIEAVRKNVDAHRLKNLQTSPLLDKQKMDVVVLSA